MMERLKMKGAVRKTMRKREREMRERTKWAEAEEKKSEMRNERNEKIK